MFRDLLKYFKESIHIINTNSFLIYLYLVGIILALFKTIIRYNVTFKEDSLAVLADGVLIVFTFFILMGIALEAGTLNLIKSIVLKESANMEDFVEGVKTFFWKILFGNIVLGALIFLILFPLSGIYIYRPLLGSLFIFLFCSLVSVFLVMWNIILVYEERTIADSIWYSIEFGKENFLLMLLVNIVAFIFAGNQISHHLTQLASHNSHIGNFSTLYNIIELIVPSNLFSIILGIFTVLFFQLFFKIVLFRICHGKRNKSLIKY